MFFNGDTICAIIVCCVSLAVFSCGIFDSEFSFPDCFCNDLNKKEMHNMDFIPIIHQQILIMHPNILNTISASTSLIVKCNTKL